MSSFALSVGADWPDGGRDRQDKRYLTEIGSRLKLTRVGSGKGGGGGERLEGGEDPTGGDLVIPAKMPII